MPPLAVLSVGRQAGDVGPEADLTTVDSASAALDHLREHRVDCVLVAQATAAPIEAVSTLREHTAAPLLLVAADLDGHVAVRATRAGVTEYVPAADLAERIRAVVRDGGTAAAHHRARDLALERTTDALERLTELTASDADSLSATVERALAIGCERLDLPAGALLRIADDTQHVEAAVGDHELLQAGESAPLSRAHCRRTVDADSLLGIRDAAAEGFDDDPAHDRFGLACYLGGKVVVDGDLYGTVCFAATEARERPFSDAERRFVELLVEWIAAEIERSQREETLQRYADTIEAVDDGVYALDDEGRFTTVNRALVEMTGHDREELLGEHTRQIKDAETVAHAESILGEMLRDERPDEATFELTIQRADGTAFPAEDHMALLREDGEFAGSAGVIRDVTDQKQRDRALQDLLDTTRELMRARTGEDVAAVVTETVRETLGFELSAVRLYDAETDTLRPVATAGADTRPSDRPVRDADEGVSGEAFQRGETRIVEEFTEHDGYDSGPATAAMYVPMGAHGLITVGSQAADAFESADASIVEILASNAAAAFERVEREQALTRYQTVVENVRDMVYVLDEAGRFQLVTEPLAAWLGHDRADLLGESAAAVLEADTVERFEGEIERLHRSDVESVTVETDLRTADGVERPAEIEVSSLPDGADFGGTVGVVRDRTELKRTRAALADERDRFSYLFNALPDPVVEVEFVDGDPVVRSVNPAFGEVFGEHDIRGDPLNEYVVPPDDEARGRAQELDSAAMAGETAQAEVRRYTADGFRDFLFRGVPFDRSEGRRWAFAIYTDITEQRERERRLEVLNRVLRHNLRNDMTVVLGAADELAERLEGEDRDLLDPLQRKAESVVDLSNRARQIAQAVRRDVAGEDPVRPDAVARSVVADLAPEYPEATVRTDCESAPPVGDGRLRTALVELVENALEHNEAPEVTVSVTAGDDSVRVGVADDGGGVPQQELDVVTGAAEITQLTHGSGLGLWLVTWLTESYGGSVDFESDGDGTTVTMTLPRVD